MRWQRRGRSANLEDRRGHGAGRRGLPMGLGLGGLLLVGALSLLTGQDFFAILGGLDDGGGAPYAPEADRPATSYQGSAAEEQLVDFVSFVLDDAQDVWMQLLDRSRTPYRPARLVLFTDAVRSGCGYAESAMGPFYCPLDERVYVDLGFYDELRRRFGAPGDFAQAYVVAHEIGHHVQHVLGISSEVRAAQQRDPARAAPLSIRLELQADCFAGVWAHSTSRRDLLEAGDVEEGLGAASAVGDDRIQQQAGARVNPETWTHGSARQRAAWFRRGLDSGDPNRCDTFSQQLAEDRG